MNGDQTTITSSQIKQYDILCGRGSYTNNHVGNRQFRALISKVQPKYIIARKRDKTKISQKIVDFLRSKGLRFLKCIDEKGGHWVDIGDAKALEKTSQALRESVGLKKMLPNSGGVAASSAPHLTENIFAQCRKENIFAQSGSRTSLTSHANNRHDENTQNNDDSGEMASSRWAYYSCYDPRWRQWIADQEDTYASDSTSNYFCSAICEFSLAQTELARAVNLGSNGKGDILAREIASSSSRSSTPTNTEQQIDSNFKPMPCSPITNTNGEKINSMKTKATFDDEVANYRKAKEKQQVVNYRKAKQKEHQQRHCALITPENHSSTGDMKTSRDNNYKTPNKNDGRAKKTVHHDLFESNSSTKNTASLQNNNGGNIRHALFESNSSITSSFQKTNNNMQHGATMPSQTETTKSWYPHDPLEEKILTPIEIELAWLGEESILYSLKKQPPSQQKETLFDWDFVVRHASPTLQSKIKQLQSSSSCTIQDYFSTLVRTGDEATMEAFISKRMEVREALNRGFRRDCTKTALDIARNFIRQTLQKAEKKKHKKSSRKKARRHGLKIASFYAPTEHEVAESADKAQRGNGLKKVEEEIAWLIEESLLLSQQTISCPLGSFRWDYIMRYASPDLLKLFEEKNIDIGEKGNDASCGSRRSSNTSRLLPRLVRFFNPNIKDLFESRREEIQDFLLRGYRRKGTHHILPSPEIVDRETAQWNKRLVQAGKISRHGGTSASKSDIRAACNKRITPDKSPEHLTKIEEELATLLEEAAYFAGKGKSGCVHNWEFIREHASEELMTTMDESPHTLTSYKIDRLVRLRNTRIKEQFQKKRDKVRELLLNGHRREQMMGKVPFHQLIGHKDPEHLTKAEEELATLLEEAAFFAGKGKGGCVHNWDFIEEHASDELKKRMDDTCHTHRIDRFVRTRNAIIREHFQKQREKVRRSLLNGHRREKMKGVVPFQNAQGAKNPNNLTKEEEELATLLEEAAYFAGRGKGGCVHNWDFIRDHASEELKEAMDNSLHTLTSYRVDRLVRTKNSIIKEQFQKTRDKVRESLLNGHKRGRMIDINPSHQEGYYLTETEEELAYLIEEAAYTVDNKKGNCAYNWDFIYEHASDELKKIMDSAPRPATQNTSAYRMDYLLRVRNKTIMKQFKQRRNEVRESLANGQRREKITGLFHYNDRCDIKEEESDEMDTELSAVEKELARLREKHDSERGRHCYDWQYIEEHASKTLLREMDSKRILSKYPSPGESKLRRMVRLDDPYIWHIYNEERIKNRRSIEDESKVSTDLHVTGHDRPLPIQIISVDAALSPACLGGDFTVTSFNRPSELTDVELELIELGEWSIQNSTDKSSGYDWGYIEHNASEKLRLLMRKRKVFSSDETHSNKLQKIARIHYPHVKVNFVMKQKEIRTALSNLKGINASAKRRLINDCFGDTCYKRLKLSRIIDSHSQNHETEYEEVSHPMRTRYPRGTNVWLRLKKGNNANNLWKTGTVLGWKRTNAENSDEASVSYSIMFEDGHIDTNVNSPLITTVGPVH